MPKRTQEQLDARRRQIREAALACFARKGFHRTTMRDICREAGLSAGAVYNYFAGKEEIIAAATETSRTANRAALAEISSRTSTQQALLDYLEFQYSVLQSEQFRCLGSIDADIYAEAPRNAKMRAIAEKEYHSLVIPLAAIIRKGQKNEQLIQDVDPVAVAKTIVALSIGVKLHLLLHGEHELDDLRATIELIMFDSLWTE